MLASKQTCYNIVHADTLLSREEHTISAIFGTDRHHNEIHAYYNAHSVWQSSGKANIDYPQIKQGSVTKYCQGKGSLKADKYIHIPQMLVIVVLKKWNV